MALIYTDDNGVTFYQWTESCHTQVPDTEYEDTTLVFISCLFLFISCSCSCFRNPDFLIWLLSCLVYWDEIGVSEAICRHQRHSHPPGTLSLLISFLLFLFIVKESRRCKNGYSLKWNWTQPKNKRNLAELAVSLTHCWRFRAYLICVSLDLSN